ncbi:hypothetical protein GF326_02035 [Candidatus Bathyarchaeota archaeon]|nr:hypothetical protein [Candidatus Bathyarchaeota archaeon]
MARPSLAKQLLQLYMEEPPGEDAWLILVRSCLQCSTSTSTGSRAYRGRAANPVHRIPDPRVARAIKELMDHYEGMVTVLWSKVMNP